MKEESASNKLHYELCADSLRMDSRAAGNTTYAKYWCKPIKDTTRKIVVLKTKF